MIQAWRTTESRAFRAADAARDDARGCGGAAQTPVPTRRARRHHRLRRLPEHCTGPASTCREQAANVLRPRNAIRSGGSRLGKVRGGCCVSVELPLCRGLGRAYLQGRFFTKQNGDVRANRRGSRRWQGAAAAFLSAWCALVSDFPLLKSSELLGFSNAV